MAEIRRSWAILVALGLLACLPGCCASNQPPVLSFSCSPENPAVGEEITFDASESYDPDGEITSWEWSFGDGSAGSGRVAKHTYLAPGDYEVTLKAKDSRGASSEKGEFITVEITEAQTAEAREWAIEVLKEVRVQVEILPRVANLIYDLMGRKLSRDEAFHTVEEVEDELSLILVRIRAMSPPPSVTHALDLGEIHTLLIKSLETDLAGLESVVLAISCFPQGGGMPLDLEDATKHIQEATANREKAHQYLDEALDKLEKLAGFVLETAKLQGICYGPFRDGEDPDCGILPTEEELREDVELISKLAGSVRTYGTTGSLKTIPKLCQDAGVDCYPGAWICENRKENEKEIEGLIQVADQNLSHVKGLIVGNEVLLRGDLTEEELIHHISYVKASTDVLVGTAEPWSIWLAYPKLAESVDIIMVHVHPYWERIPIGDAADYVSQKWQEVKRAYPAKTVVIGETGWPSEGDPNGPAIPSEENEGRFLSKFCALARENGIEYFYFEVFDEMWKEKAEAVESGEMPVGNVGAHWGLYYSEGSMKPQVSDLVPLEVREGISRPRRVLSVISATLPWAVYTDCDSPQNHFYPTGWMGDLKDITLDTQCTESPYSGESCAEISYLPNGTLGWTGIYWQYPLNNWGQYPGYNISQATKLIFEARGQVGGEKAKFKVGGINNEGQQYCDSFGPVSIDVELTDQWKKYSIDLKGLDLSMVIGGFCWVAETDQNPQGCVIYIDEIKFESDEVAPQTEVTGGPSGDISIDSATFTWTGSDDQTSTSELVYSYFLEGYDTSWSDYTLDTSKSYYDLPDRSYTFYVKAKDQSGNVDQTPASRMFAISIMIYSDIGIAAPGDIWVWSGADWGLEPPLLVDSGCVTADAPEGNTCFAVTSGSGSGNYVGWGIFLGIFENHELITPHTIDLSDFQNLEFWVKTPIDLKVQIQQDNNGGKKSYSRYISYYGWNSSLPDVWQKVTIPKSAFSNVDLTKIFCPFMITGTGNNITYYVDEVMWAPM